MQKEWDVVVVGGVNMDYLIRGERLPSAGEQLEGHTYRRAVGGKGMNQAVAAARLGARVALVASIGWDEHGDQALEVLEKEGVNLQYVKRKAGSPTGVVLIHVDQEGRKQSMDIPGANGFLSPDALPEALIRSNSGSGNAPGHPDGLRKESDPIGASG